jgi:RNA polymerase sigma-70 factor (ECF subfamily)
MDLTKLYKEYSGFVYNIALRMLNYNRIDAEDVTQEVFIRLQGNLANFKGESSVKTYIYRITANMCIDHIRKQQSQYSRIENSVKDTKHISSHDSMLLDSLLNLLSPKQKAAVLLFEIGGFSQKEIAEIMDENINTIKSQISRAIKKMAESLKEEE